MVYERRVSASKGRVFERKKSAFDLFLHKCVKCHSFGGKKEKVFAGRRGVRVVKNYF